MYFFWVEAYKNISEKLDDLARLNHCMLLHIHRNKTDDLDLLKIATEFIKQNEIILETNNNNSLLVYV